ncbi:MAG: pantetheine-phosphate adenylyltransferase [Flavobacteriaceae bacterium]|mgnify:CR=1 FL=1|jgi:pantetheine-phosphate adenylyltransferase|nr:pantetheine-phosphate adenylyltransferase [Flavobacteriaceae bacterium]
MKRAVFPGSFDPFTIGHQALVTRGLSIFDEIIIAIGSNTEKNPMSSLKEREAVLNALYKDEPRVRIATYSGLTYKLCQSLSAQYIIRGLRNAQDFNYEQAIAQTNLQVGGVETVFLSAEPHLTHMSSSIARDLAKHGGDLSDFLPK